MSLEPPKDDLETLERFYSSKQIDEGIKKLQTLLRLYPKSAKLYYFKGNFHKLNKAYDAAIFAYQKYLEVEPNDHNIILEMGLIHLKLENLKTAYLLFIDVLKLEPKNIDAFIYLGIILKKIGEKEQAKKSFFQALKLNPESTRAHYNLAVLFHNMGSDKEAIFHFEEVLKFDASHSSAKFFLSALTGLTPSRPPNKYVEGLFDNYAAKFENSLVSDLEYTAPKIISNLLLENQKASLGSVLDLGCGTGLVGVEIADRCTSLRGIDISSNMLEQAKLKNIYDVLEHDDIATYLESNRLDFDTFIAADVFIYIGDLYSVFNNIKLRNKRLAKLVFTTEHSDIDGFHLTKKMRYRHSKSYIERLCNDIGYEMAHFSTFDLRKEVGNQVTAGLYVLDI